MCLAVSSSLVGANPTIIFRKPKCKKNNLVNIAGVWSNSNAGGRETKFSP